MVEPFLFSHGDSIVLKSNNAVVHPPAKGNSTDGDAGTQNGIEQNIPVWTIGDS